MEGNEGDVGAFIYYLELMDLNYIIIIILSEEIEKLIIFTGAGSEISESPQEAHDHRKLKKYDTCKTCISEAETSLMSIWPGRVYFLKIVNMLYKM